MRFLCGVLLLIGLVACTTPRPASVVSYRVETPTKEELVAIDIDANGYVTRRLRTQTDEFQLSGADFALILDQVRAADLPGMRLGDGADAAATATVIHTITTADTRVSFVDAATPASVQPLIVSFQRVMRVAITTPADAHP
ncbi:MAG: hypothetical protein RLZZ297_394 [Chloroflexota bacterium]|jgi:hypothetical protein